MLCTRTQTPSHTCRIPHTNARAGKRTARTKAHRKKNPRKTISYSSRLRPAFFVRFLPLHPGAGNFIDFFHHFVRSLNISGFCVVFSACTQPDRRKTQAPPKNVLKLKIYSASSIVHNILGLVISFPFYSLQLTTATSHTYTAHTAHKRISVKSRKTTRHATMCGMGMLGILFRRNSPHSCSFTCCLPACLHTFATQNSCYNETPKHQTCTARNLHAPVQFVCGTGLRSVCPAHRVSLANYRL